MAEVVLIVYPSISFPVSPPAVLSLTPSPGLSTSEGENARLMININEMVTYQIEIDSLEFGGVCESYTE